MPCPTITSPISRKAAYDLTASIRARMYGSSDRYCVSSSISFSPGSEAGDVLNRKSLSLTRPSGRAANTMLRAVRSPTASSHHWNYARDVGRNIRVLTGRISLFAEQSAAPVRSAAFRDSAPPCRRTKPVRRLSRTVVEVRALGRCAPT